MKTPAIILRISLLALLLSTVASCINDPSPDRYRVPEFAAVDVDESVPGSVGFTCSVSSMEQLADYGVYFTTGTAGSRTKVSGLRTADNAFTVRISELLAGATYSCLFFISNGKVEVLSTPLRYLAPETPAPDRRPMRLRVSPSAGGQVSLPVRGALECVVDWGDGSREAVKADYGAGSLASGCLAHQYTSPGPFEVSVSGKVSALSSYGLPQLSCVEAVLDWGDTGLSDISYAFDGQTKLETVAAPGEQSFAAVASARSAFSGTALEQIPAGLFSGCPSGCDYTKVFAGCKRLKAVPEEAFPDADRLTQSFSGCEALTKLPARLLGDGSRLTELQETFAACAALEAVPATLLDNCPNLTKLVSTFSGCSALKEIPAQLFDSCRRLGIAEGVFMNCASLAGESPYTEINGTKVHLYERSAHPEAFAPVTSGYLCFFGCGGLSDYAAIPDNWKKP